MLEFSQAERIRGVGIFTRTQTHSDTSRGTNSRGNTDAIAHRQQQQEERIRSRGFWRGCQPVPLGVHCMSHSTCWLAHFLTVPTSLLTLLLVPPCCRWQSLSYRARGGWG